MAFDDSEGDISHNEYEHPLSPIENPVRKTLYECIIVNDKCKRCYYYQKKTETEHGCPRNLHPKFTRYQE